jgi:uncharacterized iron-regulated protein
MTTRRISPRGLAIAAALLACAAPSAPAQETGGYVPHRVWDARHGRFTDFEAMAADAARADVVFFGEQHDDGPTHRLEAALLEAVARRGARAVVALEMFERDVQPALDAYLAGTRDEAAFVAASRPWPNYAADYRPLVEAARVRRWPVVAGNVPRPFASAVARGGLGALDTLPADRRAWAAAEIDCPRDDYHRRFAETMAGHGPPAGADSAADARVLRYYHAQCVKDETMAESVARAAAAEPGRVVLHYNGAFHSDFRLGAAARVKRRMPRARILVVSAVPVADLDAIDTRAHRRRADYVVFTLAPPAAAAPGR